MAVWTEGGATFSADRVFRHHLWRARPLDLFPGPRRRLTAIMHNPSKAGEDAILGNDPTVRKWFGFCDRWAYARFDAVNLSDYAATDPADLYRAGFPVSAECDDYIVANVQRADAVVVAWGGLKGPAARGRADQVLALIRAARPGKPIYCIRIGKAGIPCHPLMETYTQKPVVFEVGAQ